jgi:phosphatidylserine/phosphatidylglycerophosphate/cardiolipin synthase-like enzyme
VSESASAGLLVDGRNYFRALARALERAERAVYFSGWQFDSGVRLLRGVDAPDGAITEFLPLLEQCCERRPDLRISILAWDFSFVYALEREWLQEFKFRMERTGHIRFEFERHPVSTGSQHMKFVVADDTLLFAGGLDVCDERWDDRDHAYARPHRTKVGGDPYKPFHDIQVAATGPVAAELGALFRERWLASTGEVLTPPAPRPPAEFELGQLSEGALLPISCPEVALSRTDVNSRGEPVQEIAQLFATAIQRAETLIYVETQYFTSLWLGHALAERLRDTMRPPLTVVLVLPRDADSPKEQWALGDAQDALLWHLQTTARAHGHGWYPVFSEARQDASRSRGVFIHSKLVIVDDVFLSVGSANFTNRSMGLDSELNLSWRCRESADALSASIRRIRANLLAEHSGQTSGEAFEPAPGLRAALEAELGRPGTRLRTRLVTPARTTEWTRVVFDPERPIEPWQALASEALTELERQIFVGVRAAS